MHSTYGRVELYDNPGTIEVQWCTRNKINPSHAKEFQHSSCSSEYQVVAVAAFSQKIEHYTVFLKVEGAWIYFDDLQDYPVVRDPFTQGSDNLVETESIRRESKETGLEFEEIVASNEGTTDTVKASCDPGSALPQSMDGKDALAIFRSQSIAPVNLLNLQVHKANPQPWFLAEDENLQIMRAVRQKNHAGKEAISEPTDLSNCDAFQICGKKRVFSMPHRDHHGVITTIFCDDGYKAWLMWPHLDPEQIEQWSDSIPVTHLDLGDDSAVHLSRTLKVIIERLPAPVLEMPSVDQKWLLDAALL
ncbi:hypothetical protein LTR92_000044 [Exophiala xenobiotica]|nr:hypothetical protein LTR92_000044 [Exophiala xenobiotica]